MEFNKFTDRNRLRRESLKSNQNKVQNKGKRSLSKRIIKERADSITKNNIERECNNLACMIRGDGLLEEIMYHVRFGADAYPSTFNEEAVAKIFNNMKAFNMDFTAGRIDAEEYVKLLEDIDKQITNKINNLSQFR